MTSWSPFRPDKTVWMNKPGDRYRVGREGQKIEFIVIHQNGGRLTTEQCWQVWQDRVASAHYQVEVDGTVGQLVRDADTAFHAANRSANDRSIGIEHANESSSTSRISAKTLDAGAHLVAVKCVEHKLGRPVWMRNVFPHRHFTSTDCPGHLATDQRDEYLLRAQNYYDALTGAKKEAVVATATNLRPISWKVYADGQASGKPNGNVKIVQGYLRRQGVRYCPKVPDGAFDDVTFAGVTTWQVATKRPPTGKLSPDDFATIVRWGREYTPTDLPSSAPTAAPAKTVAKASPSAPTSTYVRPVKDASKNPISVPWRQAGSLWAAGHHTGVDIACGDGTPVYATIGGDVRSRARAGIWGARGSGPYGHYVVINDNKDGSDWAYCHLSKIVVKEGQSVKTGELIGYSGHSGHVTGPHLHLERRPRYGAYGSDLNPNLWP